MFNAETISTTLYIVIAVAVFVLLVWLRLTRAKRAGKYGEANIKLRLSGLPEAEYTVFDDIMIPNASGTGTTQIDHVVVSPYGIFVIETKNYQGWIYGSEYAEKWTQNIFGNKHELFNPLLQNDTHIRALRKPLRAHKFLPSISIVTFPAKADIRVDATEGHVVYWSQLVRTIKSYRERRIDDSDLRAIAREIRTANITDKETRSKHNAGVKGAAHYREQTIANGKCPRCGGTLIERHGPHGRFYGCSNYPRCKFTYNGID